MTIELRRHALGLCGALALSLLAGCAGPASTVHLVSYMDPYFPEHVRAELLQCTYWIDAGRDIHVAGRAKHRSSDTQSFPMQYFHVEIYWHPHPGRTYADPTASDALIRYVVGTDTGTAVYSGTGYAYPKRTWFGGLDVSLETGRLELVSKSGDVPDVFGETRLTGMLHARHDPGATTKYIRAAERLAAR